MAKDFNEYVVSNKDRGYAQDQKFLMLCKGCNQTFPTHTFYRHVSHSNSCEESYGDEWSKMKAQKQKISKGAYYDSNYEGHLKIARKYHKNNKESISIKKKQYYREERCSKKAKLENAEYEEKKRNFENVWKPRMEKDTRDSILIQKYFFENSICEEIKKLRTKTMSEEMKKKLTNIEVQAEEIHKKIEAEVEEAIKKAKDVVFFKKLSHHHKEPYDVIFDIYKELNVNYRSQELRPEWVLLIKQSKVILKEIADEIGHELGDEFAPRKSWSFFKDFEIGTCICGKEPNGYKPNWHQCTAEKLP